MNSLPRTVTLTLGLILLNAAFWLGFTLFAAAGAIPGIALSDTVKWSMTALALAAAVALIVLVLLLARRVRPAFYLAVVVLTGIALLSITDQFGLLDLLSLLLSLAPLFLLLRHRAWYLRSDGKIL
ncbi:MAG: hypothetical protein ABTQ73_04835 [Caldilineales bacterium]